jgi:hypothetical protein
MEIQIDTSLLNVNMLAKNEDIVSSKLNELERFVDKKDNISEQYIGIKYKYFAIQVNNGYRSLSVYGEVINNKQTLYDLAKGAYVIAYTSEPLLVNKFIAKSGDIFDFPIRYTIIYNPKSGDDSIQSLLAFTPTVIKLFFAHFTKVKFNNVDRIFINSDTYQEAYLYAMVILAIGYTHVAINVSNFNIDPPKIDKIVYFKFNEQADFIRYNHVIDTKGDFIGGNKSQCFNILAKGSCLFFIDLPSENSIQLDPHDIIMLQSKSLSLHFLNSNEMIDQFDGIGRVWNYFNEIELDVLRMNNSLRNNLVEFGDYEMVDKSTNNLSNRTNLINLFKC